MTSNVLNNRQIARAAAVVVFGFLASGLLGLLRTVIISVTFGGGAELDAFYAAQRIPETLYTLVAGGALSSSFIPIFARLWSTDDSAPAWRLASAVLTIASALALILTILLFVLAPVLVPRFLVPAASPEDAALTTQLTQVMIFTVVIFTSSGLLMGILNARQLFFLPSLALVMNNLGQIFGALVLTRLFPEQPVFGLAWGALLGAALHLAVQLPALPRVGVRLRVLLDIRVAGARDVLLLMLPRVLGLAVVQLNFIVNVALTSSMVEGSRSALVIAWTLMFFVLGVIAQSVGTAVFPSLSALAAAKDYAGFRERLSGAMRGVLFLALPTTAGLIALGAVAIEIVFQHGEWTAANTRATAWALSFFALGVAGHSLLELLARSFYALSDTWTPVLVGLASMAANFILSLALINVIGQQDSLENGPFAGLALANSLTTLAEAGILWALLRRRIGGGGDAAVLRVGLSTLIASVVMGLACAGLVTVMQSSALVEAVAGAALAALVFFGMALLLRIEDARTVPGMLLRRFKR
jgi:putative peptidoglycan lipid II flippase